MTETFAPCEESKDALWKQDRMLLLVESLLPILHKTRNLVKEFRNGPIHEVELVLNDRAAAIAIDTTGMIAFLSHILVTANINIWHFAIDDNNTGELLSSLGKLIRLATELLSFYDSEVSKLELIQMIGVIPRDYLSRSPAANQSIVAQWTAFANDAKTASRMLREDPHKSSVPQPTTKLPAVSRCAIL